MQEILDSASCAFFCMSAFSRVSQRWFACLMMDVHNALHLECIPLYANKALSVFQDRAAIEKKKVAVSSVSCSICIDLPSCFKF